MSRYALWLAACLVTACSEEPVETTFYVATTGDDAWPGTRDQPFRSLAQAQRAVRALNHAMRGDLVVRVLPGDYELTEPLALTEADSGFNGHRVVYRADGEPGSAHVIGGTKITQWTPVRGAIVAAPLPPGVVVRTLFEDGVRADVARFPDRDPANPLPLSQAPYLVSEGGTSETLIYAAGDLPPLPGDISQLQLFVWPFEGRAWFTDVVPIVAIDPAARQLTLAHATRYVIGAGARYFLQNAESLLSAPGEFFVDRATSTLYYWPRGDLAQATVIAPLLPTIVSLRGASPDAPVHDVELDGLWLDGGDFTDWYRFGFPDGTFERQIEMAENRRGLVTLENTEHVAIVRSRISDSGYGGVYLLFHNQHVRIEQNLIEHIGINGITVQGPFPGTGNSSHDNVIANNRIHHVGELIGNAAGIDISNSGSNRIAHNWIHDSTRYGVMIHAIARVPGEQLYAYDNIVEYTRLERTCQDSGDTSALYEIGVSLDGSAPRPNTFRQLVIDTAIADPSMMDLAPNGVFLDFDTGGQRFEDIVVTNVAGAQYRSNETLDQTFINVSWEPGFDPGRIDTAAIGVDASFPAAYLR